MSEFGKIKAFITMIGLTLLQASRISGFHQIYPIPTPNSEEA